jgi:hypothetical protein
MSSSPKTRGLIQAASITLYVSLFATSVQSAQRWLIEHHIQQHPILSIILFLLVFIISTLICGSIIFTKPILLFFDGKRAEALKIVLWSLLWLIGFFVIFGVIGVLFVIGRF